MVNELGLLQSARAGDQIAFERLLSPYRGELHTHCYRMLGSVHDADDALQEALLRAWRGLSRFEGRSSLRSWLYRIATNACLRAIERRPRRVLPLDYGPPADPHDETGERLLESVWVEPYPDAQLAIDDGLATPEVRYEQRESIELAFIAALQHLPAKQRAVLILRDVLGFSAREVAETLQVAPASVDSALQRARRSVDERLPEHSQQATLRSIGDRRLTQLVGVYVDAWERGDVDAVVALLTQDALLAMPPLPAWYRGRETIAEFLADRVLSDARPHRLLAAHANGVPAFGDYLWDGSEGRLVPHAVTLLTLSGEHIAEITAFLIPGAFARFGLPDELPR
ncbi:MAG: sigma-70 family RNA polymerase sigma factor [Solirubrobacteraceae bacterium]